MTVFGGRTVLACYSALWHRRRFDSVLAAGATPGRLWTVLGAGGPVCAWG
jgi:hypothetical protein